MRVYLPATMSELARTEGLSARPGRALTASLRGVLADPSDAETGEYVAMTLAAEDALGRLTDTDANRRVVVAVDLPDDQVQTDSQEPGRIEAPDLRWDRVVSFHVDEDTPAVQRVIADARAGRTDAQQRLEELDLLWYDVTERLGPL